MKIVDKIKESHTKIKDEINASGHSGIAHDLGDLAVEAIAAGMGSNKWAQYMVSFASNKAQLKRLCGDDAAFNTNNNWSKKALAYTVGNSVCTSDTHKGEDSNTNGGTLRFFDADMLTELDGGNLSSDTGWD